MTIEERVEDLMSHGRGRFQDWKAKIRESLDAAVAEAVAAKEQEWASEIDPAVCRLQFPDGTVPGNARECAEGWHKWYQGSDMAAQRDRKEMDSLKAELAALRVPVGPVTKAEAAEVHRQWAMGAGDGFSGMSSAIDKIIAPRVAQALEAEREKYKTVVSHDYYTRACQRHAGELASIQRALKEWSQISDNQTNIIADLQRQLAADKASLAVAEIKRLEGHTEEVQSGEEAICVPGGNYGLCKTHATCEFVRKRHVAELDSVKEAYCEKFQVIIDSNAASLAASDQRWQERLAKVEAAHAKELDFIRDGINSAINEREMLRTELAAAEQLWQERLKTMQSEHSRGLGFAKQRAYDEGVHAAYEKKNIELATEKANWKAHLERVETTHHKDMKAWSSHLAKAVAAAYKEAAKVIDGAASETGTPVIHYLLGRLAAEIRQLAAKPQDAKPAAPTHACNEREFECGCTGTDSRCPIHGESPKEAEDLDGPWWVPKMEKIKAEHENEQAILLQQRDGYKGDWLRSERRIMEAVTAAYEEAAKINECLACEERKAFRPHAAYALDKAAAEIRQLASKPQETCGITTGPKCDYCGKSQCPGHWSSSAAPAPPEQALCERCHQYGPLCECKTEAHDAPPASKTAAPRRYTWIGRILDPNVEFSWFVAGWKVEGLQ